MGGHVLGRGRAGDDRQLRETTKHEAVAVTPVELVIRHRQAELGEPTQQRPEGQLTFHPGERRTEAVVDPVSEGEVAARLARARRSSGVDVASAVPVGRRQDDDLSPRGDRHSTEVQRVDGVAEGRRGERCVVAEELLDGGAELAGIGPQAVELLDASSKATTPLPMRLAVVSWPATMS